MFEENYADVEYVGMRFKVANLRFCRNDNNNVHYATISYKLRLVQQAISNLNLSLPTTTFDSSSEFGIIVAPEYFWGNKATLTEAQCNYIINSLVNLARNNVRILFVVGTISYVSDEMIQNRHAVRNVAPIIYHQYNEYGILQLQRCLYYKVNPFKEVSNQGTQYFVPGPPFTHSYPWKVGPRSGRVLNFSVEICMDHASAAACTAIQENAQQNVFMLHPSMLSLGESKDFSIVVSDFCENLAGNKIYEMVRKPTNFIHSSTVLLYRKDIISNYVKIMYPYNINNLWCTYIQNTADGGEVICFGESSWCYNYIRV